VNESGPGMTEARVQRLFEPFERLGSTRAPGAASGLDLVFTRQPAQHLDGAVVLRSRPGAGTTAKVRGCRASRRGPACRESRKAGRPGLLSAARLWQAPLESC